MLRSTGRTALALLIVPFALAPLGAADHGGTHEVCSPYPVGWCGTQDRETIYTCYREVDGLLRYSHDPEALPIGGTDGMHPVPERPPVWPALDTPPPVRDPIPPWENHVKTRFYLRPGPTHAFLEDVWESDLPWGSVWEEINLVPGLQTEPFGCAWFQWWAECRAWMGPYDEDTTPRPIDSYVT